MSLRPHVVAPVPEETARVARAAFPKGNPYLILRDALGTIFQDDDFSDLSAIPGGHKTAVSLLSCRHPLCQTETPSHPAQLLSHRGFLWQSWRPRSINLCLPTPCSP
jgi:hypothetical protein